MSLPDQGDIQATYLQYQNAVRQLQMMEQQENLYQNLIEQYHTNLETLEGLKEYPDDGDFIFPLSDMVHLKANLNGVKEILVDVGSDLLLPTDIDNAIEQLNKRITQFKDILEKISDQKRELETISSGLQAQLNQRQR